MSLRKMPLPFLLFAWYDDSEKLWLRGIEIWISDNTCIHLHELEYLKSIGLCKEKLCFPHVKKNLGILRKSHSGMANPEMQLGPWALLCSSRTILCIYYCHKEHFPCLGSSVSMHCVLLPARKEREGQELLSIFHFYQSNNGFSRSLLTQ